MGLLKYSLTFLTSSVYSWFRPSNDDKIETSWEWIPSQDDEKAETQSKTQIKTVQQELESLRNSGRRQFRSKIFSSIGSMVSELPSDVRIRISNSRLNSSNRHHLIRNLVLKSLSGSLLSLMKTIINKHYWTCQWINLSSELILIKSIKMQGSIDTRSRKYLSHRINDLTDRWSEQSYKKNICGEITTFALSASAAAETSGLTTSILGDIIWVMFICLSKELKLIISREIHPSEVDLILNEILLFCRQLIDDWNSMTITIGNVSERQGKLMEKWDIDKKSEQLKIDEIKKNGPDAKFSDGSLDPLLTKKEIIIIMINDYPERQKMLLENLKFISRVPSQTPTVKIILSNDSPKIISSSSSFLEKRKHLELNLMLRR